MNELLRSEIHARAEEIRRKMKGGYLYGISIDEMVELNDEDFILVAVWEISKKDTSDKAKKEFDHLLSIIS